MAVDAATPVELAERLIASIQNQYAAGTIKRNMEIIILSRVGQLSDSEIARRYKLKRERIGQIIVVWSGVLEAIKEEAS